MSIDWVTVIAQTANFLVLVYLLKRFLYAPVLEAMDQREQRVKDRLEYAQQRENDAEQQAQAHEEAIEELKADREAQMQAARDEAEQTRQRLLDETREQIAARRAEWRKALQQDQQSLQQALRRESLTAVIAISDRILGDLADDNLHDAVVRRFAHQLESATRSDADASSGCLDELLNGDASLQVTSSFTLTEQQQTCLSTSLENRLGTPSELTFEVDTELGLGLVLEADGQRFSWAASDFFESLDRHIENVLMDTHG